MATTAIGAGTLRRLSQLHTDGHPVLSLHLDLDPSRFPTPAARGTELSALLSHAGAVAPVVDRADQDRERALIVRLEEALGTGGPAAAGLDEVLSTLEQDRVQTLLVAHGASLHAQLCPLCRRLSANGERRCRLDGAPLGSVDAIEHALELAAHQSAQVAVMRHEVAALRNRGSIAALLRW